MCGVSAGERSIYGIREFARLKEQWLKAVIGLKLPNGLPSYDTAGGEHSEQAVFHILSFRFMYGIKFTWKSLPTAVLAPINPR